MIKTIALILVLMTANAATAHARIGAQRGSSEQPLVEQAADRVMRKFYETLDFAKVYQELYVSNPLKEKEVRITAGYVFKMGRSDADAANPAWQIDLAPLERAYLAARQFDFVVSAQNFTYDGDEEKFGKELETNLKQAYVPMMAKTNWPIKNADELYTHFTAHYEELNSFMRQYVTPGNYNSELYRARVAAFKESQPAVSRIKDIFDLPELYVAQRERLHLYFVKENGSFKLLTTTSRVMD